MVALVKKMVNGLFLFCYNIKNIILYRTKNPRAYCYSRKKKIIYVTNPKVANNSIKAAIYEGKEEFEMAYGDLKEDISSLLIRNNQYAIGKLPKEIDGYFRFSFVRDPYSRLVSCYENKYHKDAEKMDRRDMCFHRYLFGYLRKDKGFESFVKKLVKIPNRLLEPHIALQSDIVGKLDYVGKLESIQEDFRWIQNKYELGELEHFNSTSKNLGEKKWMDYYTLETAWLVYNKYRRDFERFDYSQSYSELIKYLKMKQENESLLFSTRQ